MRLFLTALVAATAACGVTNPLAPEPQPDGPETCTIWVVSQHGDTITFEREVGDDATEFIALMSQQATVVEVYDDCP